MNGDGIGALWVSRGDGIEAAFGEGVAAGKAPQGQPGAPENAETDQRDVGVFRTGGQIEALGWAEGVQDGRDDGLVDSVGDADGEGGFGIGHYK